MYSHAISKVNRVSVKKAVKVARHFYGKSYNYAYSRLPLIPNKTAAILYKLLVSAYHNLCNKKSVDGQKYMVDMSSLVVSSIVVNRGPYIKRVSFRAKGRTDRLHKPISIIKLVVSENIKNGTKS